MKKLITLLTISLLFSVLIGCTGKEVARLPINQVSTDDNNQTIKETSLELKKDEEIAIWSDMDIEYEGDVALRFKMEILKDGKHFSELEIDPTNKNITIGEVKASIMNKTKWNFSGKNGEIKIKDNGNYTFRAILVASGILKINKAEIVLKK